ncbi:hypothetical protein V494_04442 [Pseudogymnoascus sp. VKM F-4513 (FW-928)]|nr:hypothetical protein V494_04442 [Pseudogymnoascus sp. VKM F-4513 (FW-928)]
MRDFAPGPVKKPWTRGLLLHTPTERAAARTAVVVLIGKREADIVRRGLGTAADEDADECAADGGDEDIDPEGEMAEDTEEGCATDWHATAVLTGG